MKFLHITLNTVREIVREPIFLVITVCVIYLCGLTPFFACFAFGEHVRLIRDGAFAYHLMLGLAAGSVAASTAVFREMGQGTAASILAKPVGRDMFFLAKFCGVAVALAMFSAVAGVSAVVCVRTGIHPFRIDGMTGWPFFMAPPTAMALAAFMNYKYRKPFVSSAFFLLLAAIFVVFFWAVCADIVMYPKFFGSLWDFRLVPQSLLIALAITVLASIAITLSVKLRPELTVLVCSALLFGGLVSDYFFGKSTGFLARVVYYAVPNWQNYWVVDALVDGGGIPPDYLVMCFIYALLYMAAILCLGVAVFRRSQTR